jgi:hypothetical protein
MERRLAPAVLVALILVSLSFGLVVGDEVLMDQTVTLTPSGEPSTRIEFWRKTLNGGDTVTISISVQAGKIDIFSIKDPSGTEVYKKESIDSALQEQWSVPSSGTFEFWVYGSPAYVTTAHVTLRQAAGAGQGGGGSDPTPIVVVVVFVLIVLLVAFLIIRMRNQLPPPPPPEEEVPPPPDQQRRIGSIQRI